MLMWLLLLAAPAAAPAVAAAAAAAAAAACIQADQHPIGCTVVSASELLSSLSSLPSS